MKLTHSLSLGTLLLATVWAQGEANAHPPARFGEITTGKFSLYKSQNGVARTDLSGVATDGTNIVIVDDGGDPGVGFGFNFVRVTTDVPDTDGVNLPLALEHADVEGATYANGYFYLTTSYASADAEKSLLTRFRVANGQLVDQQSVNLRDSLMEAMRVTFGDEWFDSWKDLGEREGGLNIEGLSRTHTGQDAVIFGIRGPQFGGNFPNDLTSGNAILATVKHPFSANPKYDFNVVDLGGMGVRGFEWIPALHSYVIIAGPVERGNTYGLYQMFVNGDVRPLDVPGFSTLCRPESVFQQNKDGKKYLVVTSEDSGAPCVNTPFTFIRAEIKPGHGGSCGGH